MFSLVRVVSLVPVLGLAVTLLSCSIRCSGRGLIRKCNLPVANFLGASGNIVSMDLCLLGSVAFESFQEGGLQLDVRGGSTVVDLNKFWHNLFLADLRLL